jgi:membrane protein implicated in regulation of membrane protease activity
VIASTHLLLAALWHIPAILAGDLWAVLKWACNLVLFGLVISTLAVLLIARRFRSGQDHQDPEMRVHVRVTYLSKEDELEGARLQRYRR